MALNDLLSLCDAETTARQATGPLPEPKLPPRVPGGPAIPLSLAQAQAAREAAKAKTSSNGYPFATKREIVARLMVDREFRHEAMLVLFARQTDDEVAEKDTKYKNRRGLMSSHAVHGTRIAEAILKGEDIDPEDEERISGMVVRYGKQLADHYRQVALRENPVLAAQAARFGISAL